MFIRRVSKPSLFFLALRKALAFSETFSFSAVPSRYRHHFGSFGIFCTIRHFQFQRQKSSSKSKLKYLFQKIIIFVLQLLLLSRTARVSNVTLQVASSKFNLKSRELDSKSIHNSNKIVFYFLTKSSTLRLLELFRSVP